MTYFGLLAGDPPDRGGRGFCKTRKVRHFRQVIFEKGGFGGILGLFGPFWGTPGKYPFWVFFGCFLVFFDPFWGIFVIFD